MAKKRLALSVKLFWGVGQIGEGVKTAAFNSFLLFYYNQILGVSATLTSLALAIAILFDAITDPIAGSASDRFQSRWGRRHPFMAASAPLLGLTLFFLFAPPGEMTEMFYFGWLLFFAIAVRTCLTLYHVPHLALGAEMETDYNARSALFSIGLLFGAIAAYLFYFSSLTFIFYPRDGLANGLYYGDGYPYMSALAGLTSTVAIILCVWGTRSVIPQLSKAVPTEEKLGIGRIYRELRVAFSSPSYRSIFFGLMLGTIVVSVEAVLLAFMGVHFWELETDQLRLVPLGVIFGLPIGAVIGSNLVKVLDKKWCLIIPAILATLNNNVLIILRLLEILPENGHPIIVPLLIGQAFLAAVLMPVIFITINSMFADISDELELSTGRRQEGIIYSARSFASKAANALGTIVGGLALDFIAFPKNAEPGSVAPEVIFNLGLVQGPLTSIFSLSGLVLYLGYRLTRTRHQEIVQALEERQFLERKVGEGKVG